MLPSTISNAIGDIIMDRPILDQFLTANETIGRFGVRKKEEVILKIDFEKVFGHVNRSFL